MQCSNEITITIITIMWGNAQRDGRPVKYRWRAPSVQRRKVWLTPTTRVPCSNAANIGERKTWTQSEFLHLAEFR